MMLLSISDPIVPYIDKSPSLHVDLYIGNVCHHCGVSGHTRPNFFELHPHKRVSNVSPGFIPLFGELLKVLSFLTLCLGNANYSRSVLT